MKLSAMNVHYRYYTLERFFKDISEMGFKACEIWTTPHHLSVEHSGYESLDKIKSLSHAYDVKIIAVCPEQTNPKPHNIAEKDEIKREKVFNYFSNIIKVSRELGAYFVVITSGWAYYDEDQNEAYTRSVKMMKRLCEVAKKENVILAMEALQKDESVLVNTIDDLKQYLKDVNSKQLKVCLDFGAMARSKETISMYFEVFKEDLVHVHFVDGNPTGHLAWGDGSRDIKEDIETLKKYQYKGYLSLENAVSRYFENPQAADKKSIKLFIENGGEL